MMLTFEQKCNRKRTDGPTPCLCCPDECVGEPAETKSMMQTILPNTRVWQPPWMMKPFWRKFCTWRSYVNSSKAISAMGRGESYLVGQYVARAKRWEFAAWRAAITVLTTIFLCAAVPTADARGFWPFSAVHERGAYGLVAPLAAKVNEIIQACGSRLTPHGGVRHTFVAGTRRLSLHNFGQAADLAGNPRCILYHLIGWPGGASVDYARVQHYHISWGGSEWGKRFEHRRIGKQHVHHHHVGKHKHHHRKHGKRR